ncbi:MAG: hypothetical protein JWO60_3350 [Frankiales bacterium]|nr:hypothetical protein [Frankiales bacterium]
MTFRPQVEQRSAVVLAWLSLQPRLLLPGVVLVLLVVSALLPPLASAACVALVVLLAGWLSYLSWPVLDGRARAVRVALLVLLLALAATRW